MSLPQSQAQADADGLVPGRECGTCRACCQIFPIEALAKPAGTMCAHAVAQGCGIYESRPGACRRFHCLWRQTSALGEAARPDRLGVMFWVSGRSDPQSLFETVYVAGAPVDDPRALDQPAVQQIVETLARDGALPVFLHWGGQEYLVHPQPELAQAIANPAQAAPQWAQAAHAWLYRYAPVARDYAGPRAQLPPGY